MTVTPANDNAPVIGSNGGGATASVNVAENTTAVTTVTASDAEVVAQTLTYSIVGGADAALFTIDSSTGALSFIAAPDYEAPSDANADNVYEVTVQVSDGAAGANTQVISVLLTDGNEAPVGLTPANAVVGENAASGTLVATVTAVDPDAGELFSFALVQDAAGRFAIDPASGRILVADGSRLDFESTPRHDLVVRVTDAGGLSHEQTLVVTVADVADTPVDSATTPPSPLPSAATAREVDVAAAPSAAAPAAQATQPHAAPPLSSGIESSAQADIGADQLPRTDDRSGGRRAVPRQPYQRVGGATLLASFRFCRPGRRRAGRGARQRSDRHGAARAGASRAGDRRGRRHAR